MTSPERLWEDEGLGSTGILGKIRWWEESGALLSTEGKLLQSEPPASAAWVFCLTGVTHRQIDFARPCL